VGEEDFWKRGKKKQEKVVLYPEAHKENGTEKPTGRERGICLLGGGKICNFTARKKKVSAWGKGFGSAP